MAELVVEIQHTSWTNQDGKWFEVSRYPNTPEGLLSARNDESKYKMNYGFQPETNKKLIERPCRIRECEEKE